MFMMVVSFIATNAGVLSEYRSVKRDVHTANEIASGGIGTLILIILAIVLVISVPISIIRRIKLKRNISLFKSDCREKLDSGEIASNEFNEIDKFLQNKDLDSAKKKITAFH